jgi:apolipoprotein N-acyltransferase
MGKMAGAICYDFSFPRFARKYAIEDVDLVVLPSSENLGMEPLHPQIAAIRAIEGGYAILRPARFGRTTGIDPEGRFRGFVSDNESSQKTLLVTLPIERVQTLYTWIGDVFVYLFMGFIVLMIYNSLSRVGGRCSAKNPNHGASNAPISGASPL